ncbi:MAG: glycosyltransferase family 2 protein [Pyrinomonadaceae bacterium]
MRSPTLRDLPAPPPGKVGWPWTEETPQATKAPGTAALPRVSIVTPSFNQGCFLEETIRSVLLQGYSDLEYIVIDGSSTDQSVEIIRKYEQWLTYWVSEKDSGQAHAINKGFSHTTGEICAYLNSDDVFLPGALREVASFFDRNAEAALAYGDCQIIDEFSRVNDLWVAPEFDLQELLFRCYIAQPASFWRKSAMAKVGDFNDEKHFAFDYEMWLRMAAAGQTLSHVPISLAQHRKAEGTKTVSRPEAFTAEIVSALETFFGSPALPVTMKSFAADAYAIAFLNHALLNFRLQSCDVARQALETAFWHSPDLVARQRELVIRAIVDNADPSNPLNDAREYLDLVFMQLPGNAHALEQLCASVLRRVEILHSARSKDRGALRHARRLLLGTLIDDSAWMRNRAARGEFLRVLIGEPAMRRLAGIKQLLRTVRSAFPRTRKNYG